MEKIISTVQNIRMISDNLFELKITREGLEFSPGEYVTIHAADDSIYREYSIASGIQDPHLGFLIKHIMQGQVTDYLRDRKPGDKITISRPAGSFRPGQQHNHGDFAFIATGTGIAPFLSYLRSYPNQPPRILLYGICYLRDAIGYQEFREKCSSYLAVSRESVKGHHRGHLTDHLGFLPLEKTVHYYLCGLDAMIDDVSQWLKKNHISPHNIHREIFFHSG